MLTSLQKAKEQGAKIIAVNPLPEVSLMRVTDRNPQRYYPNPLELPIASCWETTTRLPICISPCASNADIAAIKGILKDLFERDQAGHISAIY